MFGLSDTFATLFNAVGIMGMVIILFAYFMLQWGKWKPREPYYLYSNIAGSACLLISLLWAWNLALFLLQCSWLLISMISLIKHYRKERQ